MLLTKGLTVWLNRTVKVYTIPSAMSSHDILGDFRPWPQCVARASVVTFFTALPQ